MSAIMVVEDDAPLREVLAELLTFEGYSVQVAGSGREALRVAAQAPPDLVVTDLRLPGMSGQELSRRLHEVRHTLPVLALSGGAPDDGLEEDVQAFLSKPVELEELLGAIRRLLGGYPRPNPIAAETLAAFSPA